jgi:hypothetical protein
MCEIETFSVHQYYQNYIEKYYTFFSDVTVMTLSKKAGRRIIFDMAAQGHWGFKVKNDFFRVLTRSVAKGWFATKVSLFFVI